MPSLHSYVSNGARLGASSALRVCLSVPVNFVNEPVNKVNAAVYVCRQKSLSPLFVPVDNVDILSTTYTAPPIFSGVACPIFSGAQHLAYKTTPMERIASGLSSELNSVT